MTTSNPRRPAWETVLYEKKGAICHIVLNRPQKLNAANDQLVEEVNDALFEFDADPDLQVAIISGAGRAFCSGADVRQRQLRSPEELRRLGGPAGRRSRETRAGRDRQLEAGDRRRARLRAGARLRPGPILRSDRRRRGTSFQIREVQRGLAGGQHWVATWFWTGSRFANEVALTGRMFTAERGLQHGMVNRVVPAASAAAHGRGARGRDHRQSAPRRARQRAGHALVCQRDASPIAPLHARTGLHLTDDFRESAAAFVEKRKPIFKGK